MVWVTSNLYFIAVSCLMKKKNVAKIVEKGDTAKKKRGFLSGWREREGRREAVDGHSRDAIFRPILR